MSTVSDAAEVMRWSRVELGEVRRLLLAAGRAKELGVSFSWRDLWIQALTRMWNRAAKKSSKAIVRRVTRELVDDPELRASFESVIRLASSGTAVTAWVKARYARPALTADERLAARLAGRARVAKRAESNARRQLKEHTKALAREQRAVKKWRAKVRYYDRKGTT